MENTKGVLVLRSFYEAIQCLEKEDQLELYNAIMEYGLNGVEPNFEKKYLNGYLKLIIPNIDSQIKKYKASVENGKKGGKPTDKERQQKKIEQFKYQNQAGEVKEINPNDFDTAGTCVAVNKTDLSNDNTKVVDEHTSTENEPQNEDNEVDEYTDIEFHLKNGIIVYVPTEHKEIFQTRIVIKDEKHNMIKKLKDRINQKDFDYYLDRVIDDLINNDIIANSLNTTTNIN